MKKLNFILLATLMSRMGFVSAQNIDINWSEKQTYDNKLDGFFDDYIGNNSKYIYAKFNKLANSESKQNSKIKIVAFDKNTMQKVADAPVIGYPENEKNKTQYQGLDYHKTIVFENIIYVFWSKNENTKEELYVQSFDSKLNVLKPLKKIYELNAETRGYSSNMFVMGNKNSDEKILIGGELNGIKGQNIKIEYKVLNNDFSFAASNQVELPLTITTKTKTAGLTSSYEFGDDGNLYIRSYVSLSREEIKEKKKEKGKNIGVIRYPILTIVDVTTGKYSPIAIKSDQKNIFNFDYKVEKNGVKVFGFYCDMLKDPRGYDTHGIFYCTIDNKTRVIDKINFSEFTKSQLDNLFSKDIQDRKDKHLFKSKDKEESEEESIPSDYIIEDIQSVEKENLVLFCTRMKNYSSTTCDSKGNCTTRYYCEKDNVTAFKISNNGTIVWATNLDRKITYNGWDIYDLNVINKNNKFYVIYGSSYVAGAEKKNFSSKKSKKYMTDRLEYAVFDYETGKFSKEEYKVNEVNAPKDKQKFIAAQNIKVYDNNFYTNSTKTSYKPGPTILICASALICPLTLYTFSIGQGFLKRGYGYLGTIAPVK